MSDSERVGWFDALGNKVPEEQREGAIRESRKMGVEVPDDAQWVDRVAEHVERDRPKEAIVELREHFDLTGTYRFLAALCTPTNRSVDSDSGRVNDT